MPDKCLICYNPIEEADREYHEKCCKKIFGSHEPPELPFTLSELKQLALERLGKSVSVTGVQPKLSLESRRGTKKHLRITIVGMTGNYILKPHVEPYPEMAAIEDLTMHLAQMLKIKTAEHSLIRLKSGDLAYITKRFDRCKDGKLALEDMAQLTGRLAEDKYRGSMEKIGKIIAQYSHYPGIDLITFYELTLFAFITGNADMHLKNFSLLTNLDNEVMLSPAYDLISTALLIPNDNEELALPINGRQNHLRLSDFNLFADKLGIHPVSALNVHKKFFAGEQSLINFIEKSFLTEKMKTKYQELIRDRLRRIKSQHMIN